MDLSFHPLSLEALDQAAVESLCLFIAHDERPLTGLAGLADWRLAGRLSRLLRAGLLSGDAGEAVLTPPGPRMGFQKLFLFGVGPRDQSTEALVAQLAAGLRKLGEAGVREAALQLPSRLAPEVGMKTLVEELRGPSRALVFAAEPHKLAAVMKPAGPEPEGEPEREREAKTAPTAPQRYVPPPPKPHVFQKDKKKPH